VTNRPRHFAVGSITPICTALMAIAIVACRAPQSAPSATAAGATANASTIAVTPCADQGAGSRGSIASLAISVSPTPSASTPVAIYVEGESSKSITRDSTAQLHRYELPRGLYDVRVTMPGFNTASARVTLTAGCNAVLTATLRKRVVKGR